MTQEIMKKPRPELRFKGFTDDWAQRQVKDIAHECHGGGTPSTQIAQYWEGNTPWLQSRDLTENVLFSTTSNKYISNQAIESSATQLVPKDSIAIVTRVGVGKLVLLPYSYCTSQDFLSLSGLTKDNDFLVYALYIVLQHKKNRVQGTSIKGITKTELLSSNISVAPSKMEQKRIGDFFRTLDNLIVAAERKVELLKRRKKAYLQRIFNQELRFKGFTDDWAQRKFGDLYQKVTEKYDAKHDMNAISVANMQFRSVESTDCDYLKTYNVMRVGDIAFEGHKSRYFSHGRFVENTIGNGIISHVFDVFRPVKQQDLSFWRYLIHNEQVMGPVLARCTSSSIMMNNLIGQDFLKLSIYVPSDDEQKLIGEFFRTLDNLIVAAERKTDLLKRKKQAYMQRMFV